MPSPQRRSRPNGHTHEVGPSPAEMQCPFCGQPVSRDEFREIKERIESEERTRIAKVEAALQARFAREKVAAEAAAKAAVDKARREAAKSAEAQIKTARANLDATIAQRMAAQREVLTKQMNEAVAGERTKFFAEKQKLEQQLEEMKRKLQAKPAHQLGEQGEIELFSQIEAVFAGDAAARVPKGKPGPDIVLDIIHNHKVAGRIIIDHKNHQRWSRAFVSKLKSDAAQERADHAILATAASFPAGASRPIHIVDGVIIAESSVVISLIGLLRRQIVQNFTLKLSTDDRRAKGEELLDFLASPEATDLLQRLHKATDDLIDLEAHEIDQQTGIHRKRGQMIRVIQASHDDLVAAIDGIIGGDSVEPASAEDEVAA